MDDLELTQEELDLLASYERDEWQTGHNIHEMKGQYQAYAKAYVIRNIDEAMNYIPARTSRP